MNREMGFRKYGESPVSVVLLHGGPGGIGEMAPVAKKLSAFHGILEPFQAKLSIQEELYTLMTLVEKETTTPITLIGYSFGAWMALLFQERFPHLVRQLILIGCPPFEEKYVSSIMETRLLRMSSTEVRELEVLKKQLLDPKVFEKSSLFARFGKLFRKCDSFDPMHDEEGEEGRESYEVYEKVWPEAKALRSSGALLQTLQKVRCPITAIHGEWDPHPVEGAFGPLARFLPHFKGIVLKECGHTPWIERRARDQFFDLLQREIPSRARASEEAGAAIEPFGKA